MPQEDETADQLSEIADSLAALKERLEVEWKEAAAFRESMRLEIGELKELAVTIEAYVEGAKRSGQS